MDVLQTALALAGGPQAQQLHHAPVPFPGQVGHGQSPLQQGQLQLEAQHDVQAVAQFIGFHASGAGSHRVQPPPEAIDAAPGITAGAGHEARLPAGGEGAAAGHPAFPEQRLALMHPHRGGFAERPGEVVIGAAG